MARILIAEDDEAVRGLIARALSDDGYDIAVASDGGEALDLLTEQPEAFDLLLADIKMPVMDGVALDLAAARDRPELIIVLMTGYADQRERAHGLDALVHEVLTKPFTIADLRQSVRGAIAQLA